MEGYEPDTIPMSRLAEYMAELANLFGEEEHVHFARVEDNCVAVISRVVGPVALGRIENGLRRVENGQAGQAREAAYRRLNDMLADDGSRAYIKRGSAIILRFPGAPAEDVRALTIEGVATVTGYLYYLSEEANGTINLRVRQPSHPYVRCTAPHDVGASLKELLFSTVRLSGKGRWVRSTDGVWTVSDLQVARGVGVKDVSVREAINALRKIKGRWDRDPLGRHAKLNEGDGDT
jgi:hypothetical protein